MWIIGVPGSGKTTLARELSACLGAKHVQLDTLFWLPDWRARDDESFRQLVDAELAEPVWVVDGSFPTAVDTFIDRATCVVWLDPPLRRSWARLFRRTIARLLTGEPICGPNKESVRSVFGLNSILLYAVKVHGAQRRTFRTIFARLDYTGPRLVRSPQVDPRALARQLVDERERDGT